MLIASGTEFSVNTATAANQTSPSVAAFPDGSFVTVWVTLDPTQDGADQAIKGQRFDAEGNKLGDEFLVNSLAASYQFGAVVATFPDGSFVVSWVTGDTTQDGSGNAIKAQLFGSDGSRLGDEFRVNTQAMSSQFTPNVTVLADGNFVISWDDWSSFDMKAQIFDPTGQKVGTEFRVNLNTAAAQEYGDIVALADGGFVATWRTTDTAADGSDQAVKARLFDSSGAGGAEFLVNSAKAGYQYSSTVAALNDGGFVITWYTTDASQDGSSGAIKAQRFDAAGAKIGGEFLVNSQASGNQSDPQVTGLPGGGFVITWTTADPAQDGSGLAIKGQAFDSSGARIGGEFLVNGAASGDQFLSDVTALSATEFVVLWTSTTGDSSGYGLRGQTFSITSPPVITSNGGGDSAAVEIDENHMTVTTIAASGGNGPLAYTIVGGADSERFLIAEGGELRFAVTPDFERPDDADGDNLYEVIVAASDGSNTDTQAITVAIGNVDELHVISSDGGNDTAELLVDENTTLVTTVVAEDPDNAPIDYSIAGGADAALFSIDSTTGQLSFLATPDHEAPTDADSNNVYDVIVTAAAGSFKDTQALRVTVGNVNESPMIKSAASVTVGENGAYVMAVSSVDPDGTLVTYAVAGGADASLFTIDALTGELSFANSPDFEAPQDADQDGIYQVLVSASDGELVDEQVLAITVSDVDEAPVITSNGGTTEALLTMDENASMVTTVTAVDPDGSELAYAIVGGADAARFTINAQTGVISFVSAPDFEVPGDADADNIYEVAVATTDGALTDSQSLSVQIANIVDGVTRTGTSRGETLTGTVAEDTLIGLGGNDTLSGGGGSDMLDGGTGSDKLTGGAGADRLMGGAGSDRFIFSATTDSSAAALDVITDFTRSQKDQISLSGIDAKTTVAGDQAFAFIGTAAFGNVAGQLRYETAGGNSLVMGDTNGDGTADFQIQVIGVTTFASGDFLL